jgi:multidrug resistance efflux pump
LLFDANDRDPEAVRRAMSGLKQSGAFDIAEPALKAIRKEFRAGRASERQVKAMIRDVQANWLRARSTYRRRRACGRADGEASVADDHARNRASREVSGCRKTSLRY